MISIRCIESLDFSLKQVEDSLQESRAKLITSIKNNNLNQNELEHYKQITHQLNQQMIEFDKLLIPLTQNSDNDDRHGHDTDDDTSAMTNTSSFKYSLNNDLHSNSSQSSSDLPKYSIGESLTSSIGGDLLALANEEEKYPTTMQNDDKRLYKYGGTGFEFFINNENNIGGLPIYTSTHILCKTNHDDKERLIQSMVDYGHFEPDMIESVSFQIKTAYHSNYAMIRVRGQLNRISSNIKLFNNSFGHDTMIIYEKRKYRKPIHPNRTLKVNNFNILNENAHKQFTDLMCKIGDLYKDISMGLDGNGDPFAIVTFRNIQDAQRCHDHGNLRFCGRNLNIQYSKFQFIKNYF